MGYWKSYGIRKRMFTTLGIPESGGASVGEIKLNTKNNKNWENWSLVKP